MAPFIPVPNHIQMEARFTINGQLCENVLYINRLAMSFEDAAELAALAYVTRVWSPFEDSFSPGVVLREIYCTDLTTAESPTLTYTTGLPLGGLGVLDSVPNGAPLCVSFRTNGRGRSSRGRNYLSGFIETLCTASVYAPILVELVETSFNDFRAEVAEGGAQWVVVSRYTDGAARPTGISAPVTNAVVTNPGSRSQRRRNPGIGT